MMSLHTMLENNFIVITVTKPTFAEMATPHRVDLLEDSRGCLASDRRNKQSMKNKNVLMQSKSIRNRHLKLRIEKSLRRQIYLRNAKNYLSRQRIKIKRQYLDMKLKNLHHLKTLFQTRNFKNFTCLC